MKVIKGLFFGALIGLGIGIAVALFLGIWPLLGCTLELACMILSCFSSEPDLPDSLELPFNEDGAFIFVIVLSAVIGLVWGIISTTIDVKEMNARRRAAEARATAAREKENKSRMESDFASALKEFDSLMSFVDDGVTAEAYRNGYVTNGAINTLSATCDKADRYLKRLDEEANSANNNQTNTKS